MPFRKIVFLFLCPLALFCQESEMSDSDFKEGLAFVGRMSAKKPLDGNPTNN